VISMTIHAIKHIRGFLDFCFAIENANLHLRSLGLSISKGKRCSISTASLETLASKNGWVKPKQNGRSTQLKSPMKKSLRCLVELENFCGCRAERILTRTTNRGALNSILPTPMTPLSKSLDDPVTS